MVLVLVSEDRYCEVLGWEYAGAVRDKGRIIGEGTGKEAWLLGADKLRDPSELHVLFSFCNSCPAEVGR